MHQHSPRVDDVVVSPKPKPTTLRVRHKAVMCGKGMHFPRRGVDHHAANGVEFHGYGGQGEKWGIQICLVAQGTQRDMGQRFAASIAFPNLSRS